MGRPGDGRDVRSRERRSLTAAVVSGALLAGGVFPAGAAAQADWPSRPIRLIIPFPPGGPTDMVARVLAAQLGEQLRQQVIPENRAGANANIGAEVVVNAPGDGYTLLYNTSSIVISRAMYRKLNYDLFKDLAPVALVASIPMVLAVNPGVPAKNFAEFVGLMKAQPGRITYGSPGNGNIGHLASYLIVRAAGAEASHVPYKGSAPALTDTAGGQVNFMTDSANSILPFIKDGRLRPLAVTSKQRLPAIADVPTLDELGLKGVEVGVWQGVLAPRSTPTALVERLNAEINKALADPGVAARLATQYAEPRIGSTRQYGDYLQAEAERWARVVKESGVALE